MQINRLYFKTYTNRAYDPEKRYPMTFYGMPSDLNFDCIRSNIQISGFRMP